VKALNDWNISKSNMKSELFLYNDSLQVDYKVVKSLNEDNKNLSILKIDRDNFNLKKKFYFSSEFSKSEFYRFPEKYWAEYEELEKKFKQGDDFFQQSEYLKAYEYLVYFIDNEYTYNYSFYQKATELIDETISEYLHKQKKESLQFLEVNQQISTQSFNFEYTILDNFKEFIQNLSNSIVLFKSYFESDILNSKNLHSGLIEFKKTLSEKLSQSYHNYNETILSFFYNDYSNAAFTYYIDIITNSLCFMDSMGVIDTLTTIDYEKINRFPKKIEKIRSYELEEDFKIILKQINWNIINSGYLFNETVMANIRSQLENEPQPYFHVLSAFNSLNNDSCDIFLSKIEKAIKKCTDKNLLLSLFLLRNAITISKKNIEPKVIGAINKGMRHEYEASYDNAAREYKIAINRSGNLAEPYFFLARVYYNNNMIPTSEIYFEKSLAINPNYIEPYLFKINTLIELGNYEQAVQYADKALQVSRIWFFYFLKADALFHQEKLAEAEKILNENCITLNKNEINQYLLLGKIYQKQKQDDRAREFFKKAGFIDPENSEYIRCMNSLNSSD